MQYPNPYGHRPPPARPSGGSNVLLIVLIVLVVALVLGGGGCLLCIGLAASVNDGAEGGVAEIDGGGGTRPKGPLERTATALQIEQKMRSEGVPVQSISCPKDPVGPFTCELVATSGDRADVVVTPGATGLSYDVPNTAFLDGAKMTRTFQEITAATNPRLRAPCFTGTVMKKVGSSYTCDVVDGAVPAGKVTVSVLDAKGGVKLTYEGPQRPGAPAAAATGAAKPRVVDFVCPPGKAPGGAVRGGCVCGSEILGTACGASGGFTDVTETPRGCRFVCN